MPKSITARTIERITATSVYQSINANQEPVYGISNDSGVTITIRMNGGTGTILIATGTFWEFSDNLGAIASLIEIKVDSGSVPVDYIV